MSLFGYSFTMLLQSDDLLIEQYSEYSLVYAQNFLIIVNVTHIVKLQVVVIHHSSTI